MIRNVSLSPAKLKALREALDLTQEEVAARASMKQEMYARYESGARTNPTVETAARIAKALKCKVDDLLEK